MVFEQLAFDPKVLAFPDVRLLDLHRVHRPGLELHVGELCQQVEVAADEGTGQKVEAQPEPASSCFSSWPGRRLQAGGSGQRGSGSGETLDLVSF